MGRIPRSRLGRGIYHVFNRTIASEVDVLTSDEAKERLVADFARFVSSRPLLVYHWCIMANHFHLAIEAVAMRDLVYAVSHACRRFAVMHHRLHGGGGHLWQGRFKSILVQKDGYLARLGRYIERNPFPANEKTADLASCRWSSARAYLCGKADPLGVNPEDNPFWRRLGETEAQRRAAYRRHLLTPVEKYEEDCRLFEGDMGPVVGDRDFGLRDAVATHGRLASRRKGQPRKRHQC